LPNTSSSAIGVEIGFPSLVILLKTMVLNVPSGFALELQHWGLRALIKFSVTCPLNFIPILFQSTGLWFLVSGVRIQLLGTPVLTPET
jgi:hypothetical protein